MVKAWASGFLVAFMSCISQATTFIESQVPSGQHSADELLSREMQAEVELHLKLSGSKGSTFLHDESKSVSRARNCDIGVTWAFEA